MYQEIYLLNKKPFALAPDPGMVFMSEAHQEATAIFRYGVLTRKGFLLLTGQVGTGKTTLLQFLAKSLDNHVHLCMIANPTLEVREFLYLLAAKFGIEGFDGNKARFLINFSAFLKECREKGEQVLLVIDEAHVLPIDILEEIRLLSNQEYQEYGVLSIFLVGQPELRERLNTERLLPLKQRIGIQYHLQPFTAAETADYIAFRLRRAGSHAHLFTTEAIELIHARCNGTPRLLNVACDHALITGYAENKRVIDAKTARECLNELGITNQTPATGDGWKKTGQALLAARPVILAAGLLIALLVGAVLYQSSHPAWISAMYEKTTSTGVILWEKFIRR